MNAAVAFEDGNNQWLNNWCRLSISLQAFSSIKHWHWIFCAGVVFIWFTGYLKSTKFWDPAQHKTNTWHEQMCFQGLEKSWLCTGLSVSKRKEECWWLLSCSALGVVLRRLLYEHSRSIAYPAAKVQAGNPQGNQTVPCLRTTTGETEVKTLHARNMFLHWDNGETKDSFLFKNKHILHILTFFPFSLTVITVTNMHQLNKASLLQHWNHTNKCYFMYSSTEDGPKSCNE